MWKRANLSPGRLAFFAGPVLWIAVANLGPLIEVARISLRDSYPLAPGQTGGYSLNAYAAFAASSAYPWALLRSLAFATLVTAGSLILCYPLAYHIALKVLAVQRGRRLMLIVAPFWTSEIVRIFAIALLLSNRGAVNLLLRQIGLIDGSVPLLYGGFSVACGMMYVALLSMLLPLYAVLDRLPRDLLDAAAIHGAGSWRRLFDVTLPLSLNGVASGSALVFLLSLGTFAVPVLLGGPDTTLFAVTITGFFSSAANRWPVGAAFSLILLVVGGLVAGGMIGLTRLRTAAIR